MSELIMGGRRLQTQEDFAASDRLISEGLQLIKEFDTDSYKTWSNKMKIMMPGESGDGTKALEITIRLFGGDGSENAQDFAYTVKNAAEQVFSTERSDNILSCSFTNTSAPTVTLIIFPLPKATRKLNPDYWMSKIKREDLSDDVRRSIESIVKKQFPSLVVTGDSVAEMNLTAAGYEKALLEFRPTPYKREDDTEQTWITRELDSQVQTELPFAKINQATNEILTYYTTGPEHLLFDRVQRGDPDVTPADYMDAVEQYIKRDYAYIKEHDRQVILMRIYRAVFKNYILDPLIDDEAISDIKVIAPNKIRVKVGGMRYTSNLSFIDQKDYERFIFSLAARHGLDLHAEAVHVFSDISSNDKFRMRIDITTPYVNSTTYPYLHIRKISKRKRGLDYILKANMLDEVIAKYLIEKARTGQGLIFCGKGASGKTTLMNCLLEYIPYYNSGLVIQESEELFSDLHPDLMFEHVRENVPKGYPKYGLEQLARQGLLQDLDYYIIGEIKGTEAKYFMMAADTGHRCWCSVHSPSSLDAISKLADYVTYATNYSRQDAEYMLKSLGTIVFMKNFKVCEISEISGWDDEKKQLIYTPVYTRPEQKTL